MRRRWPGYALAAMGLAALLLVVVTQVRGEGFSPGEKLYAPGFKDVAVSTEDTSYPPSDVLRFENRPKVIYVYLAVEGLPRVKDLEASVERSGRRSALAWLLGEGDGIEVSDGQAEHLVLADGGASGVVKFAVRAKSGGGLPAGGYTVSIYTTHGETAARKSFLIQN